MNDSVIAAGTASVLVSVLLGLVAYVWTALALQAVFRKTGEQGWKAWVPILNGVTLLQLGGFSGWWMLLLIIPPAAVVLYVLMIVACHRLNVGFGYGAGMTVLAALLFPVWASVVGWSSNRWVGASPGSGHRVGPVRTGAPAPAHAMDAPRPQALAWHTGAPAASAAAARTTTAGDRMSPATGPVPAASGPLSYAPAGYPPLRRWIAERHRTAPERVVVVNGSLEGLDFLARHLFGDRQFDPVELQHFARCSIG